MASSVTTAGDQVLRHPQRGMQYLDVGQPGLLDHLPADGVQQGLGPLDVAAERAPAPEPAVPQQQHTAPSGATTTALAVRCTGGVGTGAG